jgi:hypothetical protein
MGGEGWSKLAGSGGEPSMIAWATCESGALAWYRVARSRGMYPAPLAPIGASRSLASRRKPQARAVDLSYRSPSRRVDRAPVRPVPRGLSTREDRTGRFIPARAAAYPIVTRATVTGQFAASEARFIWCPHCDTRHASDYECRRPVRQSEGSSTCPTGGRMSAPTGLLSRSGPAASGAGSAPEPRSAVRTPEWRGQSPSASPPFPDIRTGVPGIGRRAGAGRRSLAAQPIRSERALWGRP